jgi:aspartokinase-like uncharacterized kinase
MKPVVIKVGGSLYDLPDLRSRLSAYLAGIAAPVLVVPGGGAAADVIRELDRIHQLGGEVSHWLALRACTMNGHFLARILGNLPIVADVTGDLPNVAIVDLLAFAADDECRPDHWPHRWVVTSDSMALRVAHIAGATELTLLKSLDAPDGNWSAIAARGAVDAFFPIAASRTPDVKIRIVKFR